MLNSFVLGPDGRLNRTILRTKGPCIHVELAVPSVLAQKLAEQGNPIPPPQIINGLIDTGATATCVDSGVVQALGLQPAGQTTISTPTHKDAASDVYAVKIGFPQIKHPVLMADPIHVIACTLANQGIGVLLGRDFLEGVVLIYNGPGGFFTLAF